MRASLFHEHGGPEVFEYTDFPTPEPTPNQILVSIKAVALNHLDLFVRAGIPGMKLEMPHILGSDISGVVKEIGHSGIEGLEEGQKVIIDPGLSCGTCEFCRMGEQSLCAKYQIIGEHVRGGYAEFIAVNQENVIPIPKRSGLDFVELAATPLTYMTAWRLLMTKGKLAPGDDILIIGIGGGVALAALQIAKIAGARIFVTSSSDTKLDRARLLGADFVINHNTTPDYHKEIGQITDRRGVDIVLDSVGEATWSRSLRSLRKGGKLVTPGATSGPQATTNVNLVFWNQLEILGSTMSSRSELRDVLKLVWNKNIHPVVDRIFPLSKAADAHRVLEKGEQFGKLVLRP
ncbi:MAG: zinc-binding dehydrogenase [Candidatus Thorarchaeota archaeon]|nr:zinc-binding dehydrogenase [Candidatus Thorarchaeota archaeon]MCK5238764.1 zinc-binding dehydrogenase [Candidatus Thorarchaeota archaeon]